MLVLIIKLDNLKETITTLPALSDAVKANKGVKFDWLVSESCSDVAELHPSVRRVITTSSSRMDFSFFKSLVTGEFAQLKRQLQHNSYDHIIDAQGNELSALLTRIAKGESSGFDAQSLNRSMLAHVYQHKQFVARDQQLVERTRQLVAQSLGYEIYNKPLDYGIAPTYSLIKGKKVTRQKQLIFCPGACTSIKQWPLTSWIELANINTAKGLSIFIPWHTEADKKLALTIKNACKFSDQIIVPKQITLVKLAQKIAASLAVISVDTGLAHLAVAMNTPVVTIYGPGNPTLQGCRSRHAVNIAAQYQCSPCEKSHCSQIKKGETPPCYGNISSTRVQKHLALTLDRNYKTSLSKDNSQKQSADKDPKIARIQKVA